MTSPEGGCFVAVCVLQCVLLVLSASTSTSTTSTTTTPTTTTPSTTAPTTTTPTTTTTTPKPTTTEAPYLVKAYPDLRSRAPNKKDRIAIIGATIHGLHLAISLMDLGYIDVNVYETSQRVGGEAFSDYFHGQTFLLGETFVFDEDGPAASFNKRFEATTLTPVPNPSIWINNTTKQTFSEYLLKVAQEVSPNANLNSGNIVKHYQTLLSKYIAVIKSNFGDYDGYLMRRPLASELVRLKKTFLKLLRDNKIEALKALFQTMLTSIGAGDMEKLPALYGCMFINRRMATILYKKLGEGKPIASVFKKGIQNVMEEAAKMQNVDLKFDHEINEIYRSSKGYFTLFYRKKYVNPAPKGTKKCPRGYYKRKFDHVFLAVEPYEFMPLLEKHHNDGLKSLLNSMTSYVQTYNLLKTNATNAGERRHEQFAFNKYEDFNVHSCLDNVKHTGPNVNSDEKFTICLQESESSNRTLLEEAMHSHITEMDYNLLNPSSNTSVEDARETFQRWEVQKFGQDEMAAGNLWKLLHKQGEDGLWVISRAASFPYADSTFDYNNRLLKTMGLK